MAHWANFTIPQTLVRIFHAVIIAASEITYLGTLIPQWHINGYLIYLLMSTVPNIAGVLDK